MSKEAITREISVNGGGVDDPSQLETPYTDAIRRYADIDYVRLDVPGHSGSAVAQPELAELFGERLLELDLPPLVDGIDQGPAPGTAAVGATCGPSVGRPPHLAGD